MKTPQLLWLLVLLLLICYDLLFWDQSFGVNLSAFFLLVFATFFYLFPTVKTNRPAIILITVSTLASVLVVMNNTQLTIWTAILFSFATLAFVHHGSFRSIPYAFGYVSIQFLSSPKIIWTSFRKLTGRSPRAEKILRYHKLIYLPVLVAVVFLITYSIGDAEFSDSVQNAIFHFLDFLDDFFQYFSISHLLFLALGLVIILSLVFPNKPSAIAENELKLSDWLTRRKKARAKSNRAQNFSNDLSEVYSLFLRPMLALKNEYRRGVLTLFLINALLLCVNVIDVTKVWFNNQQEVIESMDRRSGAIMRSQAVHSSTDVLIFSIFLAMAVLLFFFRGNINFLKQNKFIRDLAFIWIIQNVLLAVTVAIRNSYYIHDFGLTMKRIGVYAFVLATVIGLITFYFKVMQKRSAFFLIRVNSWSVAVIFLLLSVVDWDPIIANYNIRHLSPNKLDKQFLLWLSDHALPVLIDNKEILFDNPDAKKNEWQKEEQLDRRVRRFVRNYESRSWPSWNYADYRVYQYLIHQENILWKRKVESSTS